MWLVHRHEDLHARDKGNAPVFPVTMLEAATNRGNMATWMIYGRKLATAFTAWAGKSSE